VGEAKGMGELAQNRSPGTLLSMVIKPSVETTYDWVSKHGQTFF